MILGVKNNFNPPFTLIGPKKRDCFNVKLLTPFEFMKVLIRVEHFMRVLPTSFESISASISATACPS